MTNDAMEWVGRVTEDDTELARATIRRVTIRLLPFLFVLYLFNYVDRTNVSIAALQMNGDLRLSATAYSFGVGIFFLGYILLEVPSNLILARVGARRWIARIMISWGVIASALMLVRTPVQFYTLRFLLGVAEAGFFPGIIYYLGEWFPSPQKARAVSRFMIAVPLSAALGNPLGAWILGLDGRLGLAGWRWLFLLEGIPSVLLGIGVLMFLTDRVDDASWLSGEQRDWLTARLQRDRDRAAAPHGDDVGRTLALPFIWLAALTSFVLVTTNYGYTFWAPIVIRDTLHASDLTSGLITGAFACLGALGMLAVGRSSDRTDERCVHAAACAVLIALGYVGAALLPGAIARVAALGVVSVGIVSYLPPFWCLPAVRLRGSAAAAGIALVNSVGNAGGFVGPSIIGWVKDATGGTTLSFLVLAAFALVAASLLFVLRSQVTVAHRIGAEADVPAAIAVGRST